MKRSELKKLVEEVLNEEVLKEEHRWHEDPYSSKDSILKRKYNKYTESIAAIPAFEKSDKIGYIPYCGGGYSISISDLFESMFPIEGNKSIFKTKEEAFKAAKKLADEWEKFLNKYNVQR